jgi:hypothetical protein
MCDILWSDPIEKDEDAKNVLYMPNKCEKLVLIFSELKQRSHFW